MFKLSDEANQLKSKLLIFSGICLFVGLTESLPKKVVIIGLDLSSKPSVVGWFILVIASYLFLKFVASATLDLTEYHLPRLISNKTQNTTGNTIGLTARECYEDQLNQMQQFADKDVGTPRGELADIKFQNEEISKKYNKNFVYLSNISTYTIDIAVPVVLWFIGFIYLYSYLKEFNEPLLSSVKFFT